MADKRKAHVSQKKKEQFKEFSKYLKEYPIVGVVNMQDLPSAQLNNMRKQLRAKNVQIKMGKARVIKFAIEEAKGSKHSIEGLEQYLIGMPALLFTKENPFSLYKLLKKSKSKAAAKAGQICPSNLTVNAGPTSFLPGPIISELAAFKIKTKVVEGKLNITDDVVVAKQGDLINDKLASMLMRLGMEPMEIGLDLVAVYENGLIYTKSVLDIDEVKFMSDLNNCARWAFNLSVEAAYPTKDNINTLIMKAFKATKAVAMEGNVATKETIKDMIVKSNNQMLSVKLALGV